VLITACAVLLLISTGCQRKEAVARTAPRNLTWQNPAMARTMNWGEAKGYCAALSDDGGGWRLPSITELRTLVSGCSGTESHGSCEVTDTCLASTCWERSDCAGCEDQGAQDESCYWSEGVEGQCSYYWSSSAAEGQKHDAWFVNFASGSTNFGPIYAGIQVRCVK
jgi:uncharacterized protein (TIGR02145 family)